MFRIYILLAFLALSLVTAFATRGAQTSLTIAAGDLSSNVLSSEKSNLATISDRNIGLPLQEILCQTCESLPKGRKRRRGPPPHRRGPPPPPPRRRGPPPPPPRRRR